MQVFTKFVRYSMIFVIAVLFLSGCTIFSGDQPEARITDRTSNTPPSSLIDASSSASQEELLSNVSPAIVAILTTSGNYQSIGTGVCIDSKGYILTNNHVVENSNVIKLYLFDGTNTTASLIWRDTGMDLALLQSGKSIPYLKMAESGNYSAGEEVIAIGTPLALAFKHSATKGIISATNRTIKVDNDSGESTLNNLIQHDASINPGNSGGPLVNMRGEVVGINTVKVVDAEGMGFAIPVDTVRPLITNISANGHYDTAYIGLFGYDANLNKIGERKDGVYVREVAENSPAQKIGLKKGDVILKVNGEKINNMIELRKTIYSNLVGNEILVEFERDNEMHSESVTLGEHPCCYKAITIDWKERLTN